MTPTDQSHSDFTGSERFAPSRRRVLAGVSSGIVGGSVAVGNATATGSDLLADADADTQVVFNDQTTDGTEITVSFITASFDGFLVINDEEFGDVVGGPRGRLNVEAGAVYENVTFRPSDAPMAAGDYELTAQLQESNGSDTATATATVTVEDPPTTHEGVDPQFVEADPQAGFEYPYYLYAPDAVGDTALPVLVEPVNTGTTDDDLAVHREAAADILESGQDLADRIGVPLIVPVFPRPAEDPVDWRHYTHALDETTLGIDDGPLERVDEQVLRMVEDAQDRVTAVSETYPLRRGENDLALNGFSASGNFVDRFTFLHPERVLSVTAGGLNGMPLLPRESVGGESLPFHVGIADIESYTGDSVNLDAVDDVNQFLYMGEDDGNDTIPYDDAWTDDDLRQLALDVYGEDMIEDRFVRSQELYAETGVDAQFRVYRDTGHSPRPAYEDIVAFHRQSIENEGVSEFGEDLTSDVEIQVAAAEPIAGEDIALEAGSLPFDREANAVTWEFGDGNTAAGTEVTHAFDDPGTYRVVMSVSYGDGTRETASRSVDVDADPAAEDNDEETVDDSDDADEEGSEDDSDDADDEGSGDDSDDGTDGEGSEDDSDTGSVSDAPEEADAVDDVPGFGVLSALSGLGGAGYALRRRLTADDEGA